MGTEFILLIIMLGLSAFFSASETAFTTISKMQVSKLIERKNSSAKIIQKLKDEPSKLLSTILIGNNIVNIGASVLGTSLVIAFFEARGAQNIGYILGLATGLLTFFILVFGEIIPKTVAIRNSESLALILAWPLFIISIILNPVAIILAWISRPFVLLFGGRMPDNSPFFSEEDLKYVIAASEKEGVIERDEKEMISSIFDFGKTTVKEVMTPRPDIKAVEDSKPLTEVIKLIKETGHSRIPVYENNIDNIVGVIYSKDLLSCSISESVRDYLRSVIFIPEGKKIDELLHQMQSNRTHIAVVVDEYGVTSGIVSLEDIIEEIVGEIHDEFERTEKSLEKISENIYMIDGKMLLEDINRELEISLPIGEGYDTLGGLVFATLGKVPSVGDMLKFEDVEVFVERVLRRRITRLKVVKLAKNIEDNIVGG